MDISNLIGRSETGTRLLLSFLVLALPFPAWAVLGDTAASVLNDQARMKGTLRSVDNRTYVMHEITSSGTVVREFVSPQGAVFGVAWEGQFPPDLQSLLGPYYQQAQKAQRRRRKKPSRKARSRCAKGALPSSLRHLAWSSTKPGTCAASTGKPTFHS